jgi:hypothetical protein
MTIPQQLQHFASELDELTQYVQSTFGALSEAHLNWKPNADKWSIAQCFHHIITSNTTYFPVFDAVRSGTYSPTLWRRVPFVPTIFGREMVKALGRVPRRAIKTSPIFEPSRSTIAREIMSGFSVHQKRVTDYLRFFAESGIVIESVIIPLPVSPLLIAPLSDALTVMVNHTFRHVLQAEKVMNTVNFGIS